MTFFIISSSYCLTKVMPEVYSLPHPRWLPSSTYEISFSFSYIIFKTHILHSRKHMWSFFLFDSGLVSFTWWFSSSSIFHKWQKFVLLDGWIKVQYVYITTFSLSFHMLDAFFKGVLFLFHRMSKFFFLKAFKVFEELLSTGFTVRTLRNLSAYFIPDITEDSFLMFSQVEIISKIGY